MSESLQPLEARMRQATYSRLVSWEVWNFMSIAHGRAEFDDTNIVNFKGYNDSGKSAMLRALDVLFFNIRPNSQISFIQDDKEYFRVIANFEDGVSILRDKYINGQGLYEMYKNGETIYSTKQNNVLTRISVVPEPVQTYLGLVTCDSWNINSRSCFEKQLMVQTTGSENYRSLHEVLRAEESAVAGEMLNTDKNKLNNEISTAEAELEIYRREVNNSPLITEEMLQELHRQDTNLDIISSRLSSLVKCNETIKIKQSIPQVTELPSIDASHLLGIVELRNKYNQLKTIPVLPELPVIETDALMLATEIKSKMVALTQLPDIPDIQQGVVDFSQLNAILQIRDVFLALKASESDISVTDAQIDTTQAELQKLQVTLSEVGHKYIVCKNCGAMIEVGSHHED